MSETRATAAGSPDIRTPLLPLAAGLRAAVAADLRRVRPLRAPWLRAAALLPFALALLGGVPLSFGLRGDAVVLGDLVAWGLSTAQAVLGLALAVLALREAVPAGELSRRRTAAVLVGAAGVAVLVTVWTWATSPTRVPVGHEAFYWKVCFGVSTALGIPPLVVLLALASRGLALRPAVLGAFAGLAAGLMVDAGWRLFCHVSDPAHVLLAHGAATLALSGLGAAIAARALRPRTG